MVTKETEACAIDTTGLLTPRGFREIRPHASFLFSSTSNQPSYTTISFLIQGLGKDRAFQKSERGISNHNIFKNS